MEGTTQTGDRTDDTGGMKLWVIDGDWTWEGMTLEEARDKAEQLHEFAASLGLNRINGSVGRTREREPVEFFTFGSEDAYRNMRARGHETVAGTIASGAGQRQHA